MDHGENQIAYENSSEPEQSATTRQTGGAARFGLKFSLETGETFLFDRLPITIGRSGECDIPLDDETVSARHAQVYFDAGAEDVCIHDLDSLNGLFIDNLPTRKNLLLDGVTIGLGRVRLEFRDTGYIHWE